MYRKLRETEREKAWNKASAKLFGELLRGFMAEEEKAYKKQVREAWEAEQEENRKREAFFNEFYEKRRKEKEKEEEEKRIGGNNGDNNNY